MSARVPKPFLSLEVGGKIRVWCTKQNARPSRVGAKRYLDENSVECGQL